MGYLEYKFTRITQPSTILYVICLVILNSHFKEYEFHTIRKYPCYRKWRLPQTLDLGRLPRLPCLCTGHGCMCIRLL